MIYKDIWPTIRDRLFPAYIEERKRKQEQEKKDHERLEKLEERQTTSFELVAKAVQSMEKILAVNTERLGVIQGGINTILDRQERKDKEP